MSTSGVPALAVPAVRGGDVRVTVRPGEDALLPAGVPLGACRGELAALLRRPELRHAPLRADGLPVSDDDLVGDRPLLPGVVLAVHAAARAPGAGRRRGAAPPPLDGAPDDTSPSAVLGGPWLAARSDGPAAGATLPLPPGAPTALPDDAVPGGARPAARVVVRVDQRRPERVRVRVAGATRVRPLLGRAARGAAPGSPRLVPPDGAARRRPRRVGRWPRRWRPGHRLELGDPRGPGSWTLHRSGTVATWLDARPGAAAEDGRSASPGAGMLATAALPVVGSLVLAAVLRQPAYALFSLLGLATLVPQLVAARRRRRAGTGGATPGATAGVATDAPDIAPGAPARAPGDAPGPLLARLLAAHQASDGAWRAATQRAATRSVGHAGPLPVGARAGDASGGADAARAVVGLVPDGAMALVGPRADVLAVARSVVVELAAAGASVDVVGAVEAWSWCRWIPGGGPPVLVVDAVDATDRGTASDPARRDDVLARGGAVLLCLPDDAPVPSWCRTTWRVRGGRVRRAAPDGSAATGPLVGVDVDRAEQAARTVAGLSGLRRSLGTLDSADGLGPVGGPGSDDGDPTDPRLPDAVPLADLLDGVSDPGAAWDSALGWAVPLGRDARGRAVTFDLVADGPHLLVAGTTGAGKSELLQSLVLGLAGRRSPRDLALALVDFKGGASFGVCGRLPHVVGQVTDLDPGLAGRALAGLRAELHRRERVLAAHGAADLAALPPGLPDAPPRLVVVVDEFRALADDLPDFLPGLLRVAAQGRSLGVHLVLATQRPAGAVSADVRANVSARLALRVVDAADSLDVVETSAAARIPPGSPGRAVLRCGAEPPVALQCAHAAGRVAAAGSRVRHAPAWGSPPAAALPVPDQDGSAAAAGPGTGPDPVDELVAACRAAAAERGLRAGAAPWLPPLPERVLVGDVSDVGEVGDVGAVGPPAGRGRAASPGGPAGCTTRPGHAGPDAAAGLPLALGDDPARQRRTVVRWDPDAGHLGVVGRARSGRTTALLTLAGAALGRGWHVHVLATRAALPRFGPLDRHPGLGTVAGPGSPRRAARLLRLLGSGPAPAPTLVVVDGVEELRAALAGPDPWDPLVRALATPGVAFALASDGAMLGGLAARVGSRLVLVGREAHADVILGAPSDLAGRGGPPGRAAWLGQEQLLCQVLLPGDLDLGHDLGLDPHGAPVGALVNAPVGRAPVSPAVPPVVVRPLPATVAEDDLPRPATRRPRHLVAGMPGDEVARDVPPGDELVVPIGVGGDDAAPVGLDVAQGALVTGPRGSGRTTVLRVIARRLAAAGRLAGVVSRDAVLRRDAGDAPAAGPSPSALAAMLDRLPVPRADGATGPQVLLVDDLDALAQQHPLEADRIGALLDAPGHAVVASSTTTGTALAHRGVLAELRARRTGVVLHPGERGADDLLGVPLADAVDPGPARAGRGALVQSGEVLAVQVARPAGPGGRSAGGRLDDPARHDRDEHGGRDEKQADAREHRPGHAGGQQADADEALHDLPHHDRRAAAAPAGPQGAAGPDEQPGEPEEEEHEEHAHGYAVGGAADDLETDHACRADEQHHLDQDPHGDDLQAGRSGPVGSAVGVGRGGDRSAHDTSEYVRPAVSRQCDEALTLHARETSA
ncbi:FtsK/SpoIIIE domain-containing protein [Krasilnikoviella flava]|uniref:DNA segregation ATPase FtsK/SpoIIIE, S-DNA-T family n=1 Tax=Krasilnikoviella flava TaxID=526729 RepID=A0A1T5IB16_9MICO|nr:FtsK/SpoIIIE domain-containing protein [Krasilnikoviella flava]SKC36376.1 DNA segregation ATPase FtsK/SpoIIIE, S-DNA-T family [Krasilnikoviella flava]